MNNPGKDALPDVGTAVQNSSPLFEKIGMTYLETSAATGISVSHLQKLVHWKKIPHVKVGRAVRFIPEDVRAWIKKRRVHVS